MIHEPPPFFHRGPSPLARLTFFALLAMATMIADHRFGALDAVRLSLSVLVLPIQQVAAAPAVAFSRLSDYFSSQDRLLRENEALKARLLEYAAAAQQSRLLQAEQDHLLAMTPPRSRFGNDGMLAEVLSYGRNPFSRKLVLDKGLAQGAKSGMPVIDGDGVVGQLTAVGTFTSEVTLLTEKDQSVPVMLTRNGLRAIAVGSGKDGSIDVLCAPESFESVKAAMSAGGLPPDQAEVTMRADNDVAVHGETAQTVARLIEWLEDLDDVQAVYTNADLQADAFR